MRAVSLSLFALVCFGCVSHHPPADVEIKGNLEAMREALPAHVSDPTHAAIIARAIDGLRDQLVAFESLNLQFHADVLALNARPEATRPEFEALVQTYDARRMVIRSEVERLHFQMIDATSSEEWKGLAKFERSALAAAAGS
jgi:poly-gamma-glutamate capsule biosynthesis protein CapA/YwtB (metallophosphatase superfamily)